MASDPRRLAVLIDGDFVDPEYFGSVLSEASRHGTVVTRRIYGNYKKLSDWEKCIGRHRIKIVPNYAEGSNAADFALTIDAVEMLCSREEVNGFCIVASDNHFASLIRRIHPDSVFVMGIDSSDRNISFKDTCTVFKNLEDLPLSVSLDAASWETLFN